MPVIPAVRGLSRRGWLRWLRIVAIVVLLAATGVPTLLGAGLMANLLYMPCSEPAITPADYGHAWQDVTFPAGGGFPVRGYFIPGTTGAAVIIPPAMASGRGNRLHEADVLARHGYAVLTFESRRCAGMGPLSLGYKEAGDIGDALAYLQSRDDVDSDRIAVFGFSSAGAAAVMAAARYPDLRAVIAEGGYADFAKGTIGLDQMRGPVLETLFKWSLAQTYRVVTGKAIRYLSPLAVIDQIAPRPVLLIYGSTERSLEGGYQQYAAAGQNAELWVVAGAGHGDYLEIAPVEFEERVITFLDKALQARGPATDE